MTWVRIPWEAPILFKCFTTSMHFMLMLPPIAVIGENGAGKSTFADYVVRKYPGYRRITMGHLLDDYAREMGMIKPDESLTHMQRTEVGARVALEYGRDFLLNGLVRTLEPKKNDYLIEGLRTEAEMSGLNTLFMEHGKKLIFVGTVAEKERRYRRLAEREGYDREKFEAREKKDSRFDIPALVRRCDHILENNSENVDIFLLTVDKLMAELIPVPSKTL